MKKDARSHQTAPASPAGSDAFWKSPLGLGLLGSLLIYLALPPVSLWPLAWIAPVPWILLIRQRALGGRRPYRVLWLAGFLLWLAALYWLCLPHWSTSFGWLALSFYLAFYVPVFVGLSRVAVHRWGLSVIVAAPVVWTGLELARGHLLSGFTMGSIAHTQAPWLAVVQGADIVGCYGISGLVMLVAACVARMVPWQGERAAFWPIAPLAIFLGAAVGYGHWRMSGEYTEPGGRVALLQGKTEAELKASADQIAQVMRDYIELSKKALAASPEIDLLVWPETMFRSPIVEFGPDFQTPEHWQMSKEQVAARTGEELANFQSVCRSVVKREHGASQPPALLLGIDAARYLTQDDIENFNSALFVDPEGKALARYDKMHPVMFGEYIPLAEYLPFLYQLTPLTGGLTSGQKAVAEEIDGVRFAPNICYETVIPHLIRRQVVELAEQGNEPDVLVNLTNDGWFRGSSELDMHLACGVFRAIEMRKPLVISANTGISAWIDGDGRIVKQLPRKTDNFIIADVELDSRRSFYLIYGDLIPLLCLIACLGFATTGICDYLSERRKRRLADRH